MIRIHQEIYGRGQPLVLLHGWSMHCGIWRHFARLLAEHFQVICVDLPGHGRSESPEAFTLEQVGEALLAAISVEKFHLLGWSLGGTIAIEMAVRSPERVNSLTLLAANPQFVQTADWPGVEVEVLRRFAGNLKQSCEATLMRFLALQVNGLENARDLLKRLKQVVYECEPPSLSVLQGGLDILASADLTLPLQRLECPLSAILGGRDSLIPRQCGERLKDLRPDAVINVLGNAGHVPFLTHDREIVNLLVDTYAGIDRTR